MLHSSFFFGHLLRFFYFKVTNIFWIADERRVKRVFAGLTQCTVCIYTSLKYLGARVTGVLTVVATQRA